MGVDYNTKRKRVWGTGQLEALARIKQQSRVTALMVNVDITSCSTFFVFLSTTDITSFFLNFKHYARTAEAHLQIQLAEIPYIRSRLHYLNKYRSDPDVLHIARQPERANVDEFEVLRLREQSLRKKLQQVMEKNTEKAVGDSRDAAMVAVVGYTNSGKTSLVKCLTGAASLNPKDRLFATLDTTRHSARLPSGRKVVFTDTIGFLSDLPIHLLAAFQATLSHVTLADVIIHIRDLSNPDWPAQSEDVELTLGQIGLPPDRLNDIDLDGAPLTSSSGAMRISCKTSEGIENLIEKVDE
ncbi:putative GTP-binding protein HflX [Cooperia oncophora]